ncbi:dienelactone hydrolase [Bradyrhizobium sp. F1.4.3]|uniref:alpha/beta hydrolase family protein n=1 Tax=Bradyrhizobium sp. F1.4.3 TaxID=3156356 RepID=UPI0033921B0E
MRVLEIASAAGLLLCALLMQFSDAAILVGLVTLIVGCHAVFEGSRWQMAPAYFLIVALILYECAHWLFGYRAPSIAIVTVILGTLTAIAGCIAMPVFKLPIPTGPYAIGTQVRHIVDEGRRELFSDDPSARRELVIQIWYPAAPAKGRTSPYRDRRIATLKSAHLRLVETHSMPGAQPYPSAERFPVLLYTPSWSGIRTECTIQIEEMASHGYVVVAIDHPHCSRVVAFPDGRIARRKFEGDEDYSSDAAVVRFVRTADEQVRLRAADARFVLDTLERLNQSDPDGLLTGRLTLDRVGIFGFSLGGGTAAQACVTDHRFKAGIDLGGMIAGDVPTRGIPVPFLFMFEGMYEAFPFAPTSDVSSVAIEKRLEIKFVRRQFSQMKNSLASFGGYWVVIDGIRHRDFCDAPFFSPLRRGGVDPHRVCQTISRYMLAYFNRHVRSFDETLLDGQSRVNPLVCFDYLGGTTQTDEARTLSKWQDGLWCPPGGADRYSARSVRVQCESIRPKAS